MSGWPSIRLWRYPEGEHNSASWPTADPTYSDRQESETYVPIEHHKLQVGRLEVERDEAIQGCERMQEGRETARACEAEAVEKLRDLQQAAESVLGQRRRLATRSYLPDNAVVEGKLEHLNKALAASLAALPVLEEQ